MNCNIDPITRARQTLESSTGSLDGAISGEWDDEVKESYRRYISQCKVALEEIRSAEEKMKRECATINSINTNDIVSLAASTASQINSLSY